MRNTRKGFTLIELLIVIAIIGTLAAAMSVASSKATVAAKASAINTNIANIKTAAALYQMSKGNAFKESDITADELKKEDLIDIEEFNKVTTGFTTKNKVTTATTVDSTILYAIQKGDQGKGAYVICKFADESEPAKIATVLMGYKNLRVDTANNTVGAFLYHNTPSVKPAAANAPTYETDFTYPTATTNP